MRISMYQYWYHVQFNMRSQEVALVQCQSTDDHEYCTAHVKDVAVVSLPRICENLWICVEHCRGAA
jgi:hypothetical protein